MPTSDKVAPSANGIPQAVAKVSAEAPKADDTILNAEFAGNGAAAGDGKKKGWFRKGAVEENGEQPIPAPAPARTEVAAAQAAPPTTAQADEVTRLRRRIAELEKRIAELEAAPPDISKLDEADLGVLASEAAAAILRVAKNEAAASHEAAAKAVEAARTEAAAVRDAAQREASELRRRAAEEAARVRETAKGDAADLRVTAEFEANQLRNSAQEFVSSIKTDAEAAAASLRTKAEAQVAEARARCDEEVKQMLESALVRRDELFADLEIQRRFMLSTLEDASAIQAAFVEGYGRLRKTLDESVAHLIEPVQRAKRQVASIDRELARRDDEG